MSTASSVPKVKTGLRQFLASSEGLRESDGVRVHSAPVTPEEAGITHIILADVTTTITQAGLAGRAEAAVLEAAAVAEVAGDDETTRAACRVAVYVLYDAISAAISADPNAAGSVQAPGRLVLTSATLQEVPVDWDGTAARRAQLTFQLAWTSHLI